MIQGIDHVAIGVADLETAIQLFESVLGMKVQHPEDVASFKVKIATLATGGTDMELIQATTDDSPVAKFVAERGARLHHTAFPFPDIDTAVAPRWLAASRSGATCPLMLRSTVCSSSPMSAMYVSPCSS